MGFPESIKKEARKKACYRCCICETTKPLRIHHIIPSKNGGPDTLENAVSLCILCHDTYGHDESKRKWIKERRNWWYEQCEKRFNREINISVLEKLNVIQDLLDGDIHKRNELMTNYYDSLRLDIKNQTIKLNQFVFDLPTEFQSDGIKKLEKINEEIGVIKNINNLIETLSLEYSEDYTLWKAVIDFLLRIDINQLIIQNDITGIKLHNSLFNKLTIQFGSSVLQMEHMSKDIGVDIGIKSSIAIELKILRSNHSKDTLIGQITEILRISNCKFGIGFAIDISKNKRFTPLNGLCIGEKRNIVLIVKSYNTDDLENS